MTNKLIADLVIDTLKKMDIESNAVINMIGNSCKLYFNWSNDTYLQIKQDGHFYIYDEGRQTLHINNLFISVLFYYVKFKIIFINYKNKIINRNKNKAEKDSNTTSKIKDFKTKYF